MGKETWIGLRTTSKKYEDELKNAMVSTSTPVEPAPAATGEIKWIDCLKKLTVGMSTESCNEEGSIRFW